MDSCNWTDIIGLRGAAHDWQDIMRRCYLMHGRRCGASVHDTELSHDISNPQLVHQTPQLLTEEWSGVTIKYVFTSHPCFVPLLCSFPRVISDVLQYNSKVAFLLWHITHLSSAIQSLFRGNIFVVRKSKSGRGKNIIRAGPVQCLADRAQTGEENITRITCIQL